MNIAESSNGRIADSESAHLGSNPSSAAMERRELWFPAVVAQFVENKAHGNKLECQFDRSKQGQILLIPGMGAPVSQLFPLTRELRKDLRFSDYGVTAIELGLSLGDFHLILDKVVNKINTELLSQSDIQSLILYGHSHGGRFASAIAANLQMRYPGLSTVVITGGTPITKRPTSRKNWLLSDSFRNWPEVLQPSGVFISLYSGDDEIVDVDEATFASNANLMLLENFTHNDFIRPQKMIPVLQKIIFSL